MSREFNQPHVHQHSLVPSGMGEFVVQQTPNGPVLVPVAPQGVGQAPKGLGEINFTTIAVLAVLGIAGYWAYKKYIAPKGRRSRELGEDDDNPRLYESRSRVRRSKSRVLAEAQRLLEEADELEELEDFEDAA